MSNATCFDPRMLKDYLLGKLPDEQSDVISAHLEACLSCEATVAQLDRTSDTLTDGLRLPVAALVGTAEQKSDVALKQALSQVQSLEFATNSTPISRVEASSVTSSRLRDSAADQSPVLRDYRLLEPIGSGGMGAVYKAVHTRLDRLVAVKLLPARRLGDEQAVARFQREMRVIGQLSHPAIVQATDAGEVDGTHFLVMEYVEGLDLNRIAKACGNMSVADACEIARQTALGLEYAHQQGIVHRDIKPSNLMLSVEQAARLPSSDKQIESSNVGQASRPSYVKILDLGLALLSGEQAPVDELTTVGQLMGTLDYMAPEQLEDSHQVGPRADIYALAATLYRLLTGSAPFAKADRKTPLQKLRALATLTVMPIRERRADLPEELAATIDRALIREPAERFASMPEFAAALAPWCAGHDLGRLAQTAIQLAEPLLDAQTNWQQSQFGERQWPISPIIAGEPEGVSPRTSVIVRGLTPSGSPEAVGGQAASANLLAGNAGAEQQPPRRKFAVIALALMLFVALGVVITIETNKGQIVVESVRDGVEVRVKRSGQVVDNLEIKTGSKSTRLAAGEYEIEIVGQTDGLSIQNGKFVLKRGDVVIAKIVEIPKDQAVAQHAHETEPDVPKLEPAKRVPVEIVDRQAKGMENFEAANPDWAAEKKLRDALRVKIEINFVDTPLTDCIAFLQDYLSEATKSEFRILLDEAALHDANIPTDTPITLMLKNIGASDVLEIMFRRLNCVWQIDNGQILITAKSKENETQVTRTYPVGKLMPGVRQAVARIAAEQPKAINGGGGFFSIDASTDVGQALLPVMLATTGKTARPRVASHRPEIILCQGGGAGGGAGFFGHLPPAAPNEASHLSELLGMLGHEWQSSAGKGGSVNLLGNMLVVRHSRKAHADIESLIRTIEAAFLKPLTESAEIRPTDYPLEADAYVRQQLAKNVEVFFADSSLTDFTAYLADELKVQVLIDHERLDEAKIATNARVTMTLNNVTGEVALLRLLKPLQMTTRVDRGVLVITTIAAEQQHLLTKVYDVRNLLARGLTPSGLLTSLQETGTSGPWQNQNPTKTGGQAMIFGDTLLVMSQSATNHGEATKFLASLKAQLSDRPEVPLANVAGPLPGQDLSPQNADGTKRETTQPEPAPRGPVEIFDRNAKGMETFEVTNPDVVVEKKAFEALKKNISIKFVNVPPAEALQMLGEKTGLSLSIDKQRLTYEGISLETPINLSFDNQPASVALHHVAKTLNAVWYFDEGAFVVSTASHESENFLLRMYPIGKLLPGVKMAIERLASEPPPPKPAGGGGGGFFDVSDMPKTLRACPRSKSSISRNALASGSETQATLEPDASAFRLMRVPQTILRQFGGGGGGGGQQQVEIPTVHGHFQTLLTTVINGPWQNTDGEGGTIELLQNVLVIRHTRRVHADVESLVRALEAAFAQPFQAPLTLALANASPEADQHVRQQLARPIDAEFKGTKLTEFAKQFGEQLGVPVLIDQVVLNDDGVWADKPISFSAKELAAESLLSHVLKPLDLAHVIEHGQLVITTADGAHHRLMGTIHDVRHLLNRGLHPDRLTQAIESATVGPWFNVVGEGGSLNLFADTLLIVHQSSRTHAEVTKFLASLNSQLRDQPEVPRAVLPQNRTTGPAKPRANIPTAPQTGGPTTTPPTKSTTDNLPEYDGKSIEQWFAVLDTERSPTRLAEAFDAIRFLAQKSHAEQISERALRVFRNVDAESQFGSGKEIRQVSTINSGLLGTLPPATLVSACAKELNQGNERSRMFVLRHVMRSFQLSSLESNELVQALLQTSRDQDDSVREQSVSWLSIVIYNFPKHPLVSEATVRLRELLSDKATPVVLTACRGLFASKGDGPAICDALSPLVIGNNDGEQNEALWLLVVMGPSAEKAVPALSSMLLSEGNPESHEGQWSQNSYVRTSGFFSKYSGRSGRGSRELISKELAIIALARIDKAASPALPTIQQALEKRKDQISRGSLDVVSSIRDLLLATKGRIEEQPIPNAERLAKNELTQDDLDLMESTYRMLRLENEMLRQFFGVTHPSVRELDARMKTLRETYEQARTKGQRPAKNDSVEDVAK